MLRIEMPKFVWLVEYSTPAQYDAKSIQWLIILDATAMNYFDNVFLVIKSGKTLIVNRSDTFPSDPFPRYAIEKDEEKQYTHNLEEVYVHP